MKIGNIEIKGKAILAPMAGVTSAAFRTLCKEHGAGLVYAEMVSDKGLQYHNKKTLDMLEVKQSEHPLSMQLFGADAQGLLEAAKITVENTDCDIIDINMGCPVKKVISGDAGSALLKNPEEIYNIVYALSHNINKPITVKIRLGWDHQSINCVDVAKLAEKAGASAIAIHGRTRSDMYLGHANYDYIKMVKEAVSIPVIANGDVTTPEEAKQVLDYTGCDAVMIGRAACGNPWIFDEINTYLETGKKLERPSKEEILNTMIEHAVRLKNDRGEQTALVEMRTHAAYYLKNLIGTKPYKVRVVSVKSLDELKLLKDEILNDEKVYVK